MTEPSLLGKCPEQFTHVRAQPTFACSGGRGGNNTRVHGRTADSAAQLLKRLCTHVPSSSRGGVMTKSAAAQRGGRRRVRQARVRIPAPLPRKWPFRCLSEPREVQYGDNTGCLIGLLAKME